MVDQNGSQHDFELDGFGRPTSDTVSKSGSGIATGVLRINTQYEIRGMVDKVTSYSDTAGTAPNVVNEVALVYNEFGQLTSDEQAHSTATGSAPKVQYAYVNGTGNTIRRTTVTYPNTKTLDYSYGATDTENDKLSRVEKQTFATTDVVDYKFFGLGNIAKVNYPQPGVDMTLATSSTYSGFDRFGRVIDLPWTKTTAGDLAHLKYGYDQASNRIYRENVKATAESAKFDELYRYDGLQRLNSFNRGQLKLPERDRITTLEYKQDWQLDQTGNWSQFSQCDQSSQSNALDQQRTTNAANEITSISSTVGNIWKTPTHDRNGNMTKMPKPSDLVNGFDAKYDAWNRLTKITETTGGAAVGDYQYDGLNRRITKLVSGTTTNFYYSDNWQVLEEQVSSAVQAQYVWGIRYIDDLVLRDDNDAGTLDRRMYALQDANWNVTAITDSLGTVVQRFEYDAYGKSEELNENFTSWSGIPEYNWEYRYTGRRLDLETDLYQYRNRYYHAELGRFISTDPAGVIDGINLYGYVGNSPTNSGDPLGLWKKTKKKNIYESEGNEDSLRSLAMEITGDYRDWVCIWPYPKKSKFWDITNYPVGEKCALADVSNLTATEGKKMTMRVVNQKGDRFMKGVGRVFKAAKKYTTGVVAANHIIDKSEQGKKPISSLVIGGHCFGNTSIGNPLMNRTFTFSVNDLYSKANKAKEKDDKSNTLEHAEERIGPPRCWFTRNAKIYGYSCGSATFWAPSWANTVARKGSTVYGTTGVVTAGMGGKDNKFGILTLAPAWPALQGTRKNKSVKDLLGDPGWQAVPGTQ